MMAQKIFSVVYLASVLMITPQDCLKADTTAASHDLAPFIGFTNWLDRFSGESEMVSRSNMVHQGRFLAECRRGAMRNLIRSDPRQALKFAISDATHHILPTEIETNIERRISGIGDFEVFCADQRRGGMGRELYQRFVTVSGQRFRAYVYGRRSGQTTKHGIPLHGIAIGDVMAVDESVLCPLQGSGDFKADLAGKIVKFSSAADFEEAEKQLEAAESCLGPLPTVRALDSIDDGGRFVMTRSAGNVTDRGKPGGGGGSTWTTGNKNILIIRVDFSDLPGEPSGMTVADVQLVADGQIAPYYLASSYGLTSLSNTVTAVYRMPQPAAFYSTNNNTTQLMTDAQAAAGTNYNLSQFDHFIVFFSSMAYLPGSAFTWTGLSGVGSGQSWINGVFNFGNVAHELGHTFGLYHANLWLVSDGNPISWNGSSIEYHDDYDTMGDNYANDLRTDFNPWFKNMLGWITNTQVQSVTKSGTYRINRYDISNASGVVALKIVKDATHNYWVGYKGNFTNNASLQNGAYIIWGYNSNNHSDLIDVGTPGNGDQDAGLIVGAELVDPAANVGISPVGVGSSNQVQYLDVKVTFGSATPTIYVQPQSQTAIVGQNISFPVVGAGIPTPIYIWQRKASGTATWNNLADSSVYNGSATGTLTVISATSTMDSDQFRCVLTNASGSITTSPPAVLSVIPTGVSTLAGLAGAFGWADGTGSAARFRPAGVAADGLGNVYVADQNNHVIRKITAGGVTTTIAGQPQTKATADGTNSAAGFTYPTAICLDSVGNLYVADSGNELIRKVTPLGTNWVVTTIAGQVRVAGNSDGPGLSALFNSPYGIAVDPATNLLVADVGNGSIRKLTPAGTNWVVSTVANGFSSPHSVCTDKVGNIYVADTGTVTIDTVTPTGQVSVLAGNSWRGTVDGTGTNASFAVPLGIAADVLGNLYVTDQAVIRKIGPGAVVTTIAGEPGNGGSSDGALTNASFSGPWGISTDPYGNIYVADSFNYEIRKVVTGPPIQLPRLDGVVAISNYMRFVLDGPAGSNYYLQASVDLTSWSVLSTNVIPVGGWTTVQNPTTNKLQLFYRASTQRSSN